MMGVETQSQGNITAQVCNDNRWNVIIVKVTGKIWGGNEYKSGSHETCNVPTQNIMMMTVWGRLASQGW